MSVSLKIKKPIYFSAWYLDNGMDNRPFRPRKFDNSTIKTITSVKSNPKRISLCAAICAERGPESCQGFIWDPEIDADNCRLVDFHHWANPKQAGNVIAYTFLD